MCHLWFGAAAYVTLKLTLCLNGKHRWSLTCKHRPADTEEAHQTLTKSNVSSRLDECVSEFTDEETRNIKHEKKHVP